MLREFDRDVDAACKAMCTEATAAYSKLGRTIGPDDRRGRGSVGLRRSCRRLGHRAEPVAFPALETHVAQVVENLRDRPMCPATTSGSRSLSMQGLPHSRGWSERHAATRLAGTKPRRSALEVAMRSCRTYPWAWCEAHRISRLVLMFPPAVEFLDLTVVIEQVHRRRLAQVIQDSTWPLVLKHIGDSAEVLRCITPQSVPRTEHLHVHYQWSGTQVFGCTAFQCCPGGFQKAIHTRTATSW